MTLLLAVGALHLGPVGRLWAAARVVTHLVAVAALDLAHVLWLTANALACGIQDSRVGLDLRALASTVTVLLAVTALHDALVDAVTLAMTLLTAVAANIWRLGWALAAHVANLVADVALEVEAWLWALKEKSVSSPSRLGARPDLPP